jgi:hypothetical protein
MTSGGFDNPILIKPLKHVFEAREIKGRKVYEHVTNRRQSLSSNDRVYSRIPLLPTVELMAPLKGNRFTRGKKSGSLMLEVI